MYPKRPAQLSYGVITQPLMAPAGGGNVTFRLSWVYNKGILDPNTNYYKLVSTHVSQELSETTYQTEQQPFK